MTSDTNDATNFPYKLFRPNRQVSSLWKVLANNSSATWKSSKTQIYAIIESGGFLGKILGSLISQFNINKKIDQALTTSIVIQLGLISTVSAADAEIHKKNLGSAMTTLIISNEEMEDIKMIKNLEEPGL